MEAGHVSFFGGACKPCGHHNSSRSAWQQRKYIAVMGENYIVLANSAVAEVPILVSQTGLGVNGNGRC